jgi:hypothetical protein
MADGMPPLPLAAFSADPSPVLGLAKAIQLSVAPVFLLTAIAGLLGVISSRLTRVIERALVVKAAATDAGDLQLLRRRMALLTRASALVTITGVLVAAVVAVTFLGAIAVVDLTPIVVSCFVLAMLSLMGGLLLLLLDTRLASRLILHRF